MDQQGSGAHGLLALGEQGQLPATGKQRPEGEISKLVAGLQTLVVM